MDFTPLSLTPPPTHGLTIFLLSIFHLLLILTKRFLYTSWPILLYLDIMWFRVSSPKRMERKDGKQKLTYELEHESKERQRCLWWVEDGRRPALGTFWWRNRWHIRKDIRKDRLAWFIINSIFPFIFRCWHWCWLGPWTLALMKMVCFIRGHQSSEILALERQKRAGNPPHRILLS